MSHRPLREAVVELLESRSLGDEQVERLKRRLRDPERPHGGDAGPVGPPPRWPFVGVGLALAVAGGLVLGWWPRPDASPPSDAQPDTSAELPLATSIANEVAQNHFHRKPLEVTSPRFAEVKSFFSALDFALVDSRALRDKPLLGGRHCSIQGVEAAQLRLDAGPDTPPETLYMVGYDPARFGPIPDLGAGDDPLAIEVRGIEVRLWVEKGLLVAATDSR